MNLRNHFWFAAHCSDRPDVQKLLNFWDQARRGTAKELGVWLGRVGEKQILAPMAAYQAGKNYRDFDEYLLMQHGSYQMVHVVDQPRLHEGILTLYRGIGKADKFEIGAMKKDFFSNFENVREKYFSVVRETLSCSVKSFNCTHGAVVRSETSHLNHETRKLRSLLEKSIPEVRVNKKAAELVRFADTCFTLSSEMAKFKFGPSHIVAETPITNVRLTTFFAGENEVLPIDPELVDVKKYVGCTQFL